MNDLQKRAIKYGFYTEVVLVVVVVVLTEVDVNLGII